MVAVLALLGPLRVPQAQTQRGLRRRAPWPACCLLAPGSQCPRHMRGMPPVGGVQDARIRRCNAHQNHFCCRVLSPDCADACAALTHATTHSFTVSPLRQRRVVMQCLAKAWAPTSGRQQQQTPPQQHNTTIPQHHNTNTTTPQHHNTTTPQHPTSVVLGRCSTCSSIDPSDVAAERLQRHRPSPANGAPKQSG